MGALEFIAAVVKALAWPATAVAAILMFRRPLVELIPNLRRFKSPLGEAEFEKDLVATEKSNATLPRIDATDVKQELEIKSKDQRSPEQKVLQSWAPVRKAIWALAETRGMPGGGIRRTRQSIQWLREQGIINLTTSKVLLNLKKMRDALSTGELMSVNPQQADRFLELAATAVARLQKIKSERKTS